MTARKITPPPLPPTLACSTNTPTTMKQPIIWRICWSNSVPPPTALERAITLAERFKDAPNPYFLDTYGWVLFKSGKPESAVEIFKKAVTLVPDNAEFHYHLGEAYYAAGDKNAAKLALEKSLSLAPKSGEFAGINRAKELLKQAGKPAGT